MPIPTAPPQAPQIKITAEMMKNFKTVTCVCGGMIFEQGVVFKKISALVSPTGREETHALEVMVCRDCGKVPAELDTQNVLPDEVKARPKTLDYGKTTRSHGPSTLTKL